MAENGPSSLEKMFPHWLGNGKSTLPSWDESSDEAIAERRERAEANKAWLRKQGKLPPETSIEDHLKKLATFLTSIVHRR